MNLSQFQNPPPEYREVPFWSWNDDLDSHKLRIHITEVEPGSRSHGAHTHTGVEVFYVLEGQATVEVEGELYTLDQNQALALDASRPHGIFNGSAARIRYMVIISQ